MKAKDFIKKNNWITYPEPREPYVKDGKTIGKIVNGKPIPLSKSDAIGPDGKIYFWMDPRSRGEEEKPFKFKPSEFKPRDNPSSSGKLYPDPLEPVFKDGKPVGVVMPDGRTRSWSKSDALGPDGKVYFWMDPRSHKNKAKSESSVNEALSDLAKIAVQAVSTGNMSQWMELDPYEKMDALYDAGYINNDKNDRYNYRRDSTLSDRKINQLMQQHQDDAYQLSVGSEKRAELKIKVDEIAEMQRQQLRQERIEDQKIAYDRYKDEAERKDAMDKIDKEYKNNLEVINTEHRNNMESIRTGNKHEIDKINLDHAEAERDRKQERDRDQADRDERKQERDREERNRERDDRKQDQDRNEPKQDMPEPEDDDEGEPFRPQAPAGPALSAPKPDKKPSKYDNSDVIDVDAKEVPDDETPNKPAQLPKPSTKESLELARIRQLAGR